ncbi:acyl-CoA N-acyltransferase [Trichodelitschia bisporula]|uniref:Acyl-CoA N-acyltransferase n=1 Tax=Trichodelitschia bisporula TaxID=703511 RepID=A0A6G1HXX6_9PEZI|nr:acyl-CoA N-acyltransferase [Trichodelitschia bisporula]
MNERKDSIAPDSSVPGYILVSRAPRIDACLHLRVSCGLTPRTAAQAELALAGSWYMVHILHLDSNKVVGMGRIIGDGGGYFHIVDIAILPEHQRRGLGDWIMHALIDHIKEEAPEGAYVNLIADLQGKKLYARHGFVETSPKAEGMERRF